MISEINPEAAVPPPDKPAYRVPWKFVDNWIGVVLLAIIDVAIFVLMLRGSKADIAQSALIALLELSYLLPVVVIFAWRRIHWRALGFGRFDWTALAFGCGFLIAGYVLILLHNGLLYLLGVDTQGEEIVKMFAQLESPGWFFFVGAIVAPFVEEVFFRGFLFQGFRQRYGWITASLLSSLIFAAAHLDLVSLIPTFILGNVLAYAYHRSNSVWPGILLHFLVNAFGLLGAYFATNYQSFIPS